MKFQPISVTVPENRIADVYAFVAKVTKEEMVTSGGAPLVETDVGAAITPGFEPGAVRKAYAGGSSAYWRPFLEAIAKRSGDRVDWETLCGEIGLSTREASGMLGAAERRCKKQPPYEKVLENGVYWFRMPPAVAQLVQELAAQ